MMTLVPRERKIVRLASPGFSLQAFTTMSDWAPGQQPRSGQWSERLPQWARAAMGRMVLQGQGPFLLKGADVQQEGWEGERVRWCSTERPLPKPCQPSSDRPTTATLS